MRARPLRVACAVGVAGVPAARASATALAATQICPTRHKAFFSLAGLNAGAGLAALLFWRTYWKNATWSDDPDGHLAALFVDGFTAASSGVAVVHRKVWPA